MNESDFGYAYDISYDIDTHEDVIQVDADEGTIYLTLKDLELMSGMLR